MAKSQDRAGLSRKALSGFGPKPKGSVNFIIKSAIHAPWLTNNMSPELQNVQQMSLSTGGPWAMLRSRRRGSFPASGG